MNHEQFRRLDDWFQRAIEADDRAAVIEACRVEDPALVERLEAMLAADEAQARDEDRLRRVVAEEAGDDRDRALPERIGPFEVVKRLGAGGMGVVYCAADPITISTSRWRSSGWARPGIPISRASACVSSVACLPGSGTRTSPS